MSGFTERCALGPPFHLLLHQVSNRDVQSSGNFPVSPAFCNRIKSPLRLQPSYVLSTENDSQSLFEPSLQSEHLTSALAWRCPNTGCQFVNVAARKSCKRCGTNVKEVVVHLLAGVKG